MEITYSASKAARISPIGEKISTSKSPQKISQSKSITYVIGQQSNDQQQITPSRQQTSSVKRTVVQSGNNSSTSKQQVVVQQVLEEQLENRQDIISVPQQEQHSNTEGIEIEQKPQQIQEQDKKIRQLRHYTAGEDLGIIEFVKIWKDSGNKRNPFKSEEIQKKYPLRSVESLRDRYKRYLKDLTEEEIQNLKNVIAEKGEEVFVHFVKSSDNTTTKREIKFISAEEPEGPKYRTVKEKMPHSKVDDEFDEISTRKTNNRQQQQGTRPSRSKQHNKKGQDDNIQLADQDIFQQRDSFGVGTQQQQQQQYNIGKRRANEGLDDIFNLQDVQRVQPGGVGGNVRQKRQINSVEGYLEGFGEEDLSSTQNMSDRFRLYDDYYESEEYTRFLNNDINLRFKYEAENNIKTIQVYSKNQPQLKDRLETLGAKYGKELKDVVTELESVSGDFGALVKLYEQPHARNLQWIQMEDDLLRDRDPRDPLFQLLVHNKGPELVKRRLKFLKINKSIF